MVKTFKIPTIHCGHCTRTIERELAELAGVNAVKADAATKEVTVEWQEPATWDKIASLLEEINYPAEITD